MAKRESLTLKHLSVTRGEKVKVADCGEVARGYPDSEGCLIRKLLKIFYTGLVSLDGLILSFLADFLLLRTIMIF